MSVTDGIGQTPCSLEHYLVLKYHLIPIRTAGEETFWTRSQAVARI